jgi:hypothetical protein
MCPDKKFTKEEADYVEKSSSPAEHRCGTCTYHLHTPGVPNMECGIVEGIIDTMGGCKFFDINLIVAANDPHNLTTDPPKP